MKLARDGRKINGLIQSYIMIRTILISRSWGVFGTLSMPGFDLTYEPSSFERVLNPSDRVKMTPSPGCKGAKRDHEYNRDRLIEFLPFRFVPFLCIFTFSN